jgi:hypothetical protein
LIVKDKGSANFRPITVDFITKELKLREAMAKRAEEYEATLGLAKSKLSEILTGKRKPDVPFFRPAAKIAKNGFPGPYFNAICLSNLAF